MNARRPHLPRSRTLGLLAAAALLALTASDAIAQNIGDGNGMRFGVSFGGISTFGLTVEWFREHRSIELTAGTWAFRDLSVSAVGKQYFGGGAAKPFVGAGLWFVLAKPADERTGLAMVLRAPVGVDWRASDHHALGAALNVNRGLFVRRTDPEDDLPLNKRLVPLPELYYRFTR